MGRTKKDVAPNATEKKDVAPVVTEKKEWQEAIEHLESVKKHWQKSNDKSYLINHVEVCEHKLNQGNRSDALLSEILKLHK